MVLLALNIIAQYRTKVNMKEVLYLENFYSCEQIAERYGVHVVTVWRWIRKAELPAIKIGRQYFITHDALAEFERKRCTVPAN